MTNVGYYAPKLQKRTLKGHSGPVLCLAHSSERLVVRDQHLRHGRTNTNCHRRRSDAKTSTPSSSSSTSSANYHPSLLLSGSEDGSVRLWDLRTRKTSICIHMPNTENNGGGGNEVTSVAFHPLLWAEDNADYDGEDKCNISHRGGEESSLNVHSGCNSCGEYTIYASTSHFVYGYDLRQYYHEHHQQSRINSGSTTTSTSTTLRITQEPPHFDLTPLLRCTDEINQLSFTFRKNTGFNAAMAATATVDDTGGSAPAMIGRDRRYYDIFLSAADDSGEVHIIENPPCRYYNDTTITTTLDNNNTLGYPTSDCPMKPTILCHADPHTLGIASCASFQPISTISSSSSSSLLLATGGTDCTVKLWDVSQSHTTSSSQRHNKHRKKPSSSSSKLRKQHPPRPTSILPITPYETSSSSGGGKEDSSSKLFNPPYVHTLSWSASGQFLAAGIGDGSIAIYHVEGNKTLTNIGRLGRNDEVVDCNNNMNEDELNAGHGSAVASVRFANFGRGRRRRRRGGGVDDAAHSNDVDDRLLLSAGNDGTIIFWDLGRNMVGHGPLDPMRYLFRSSSTPATTTAPDGVGNGGCQQSSDFDDDVEDEEDDVTPSPPRVLFKIAHCRKPNWITCSPVQHYDSTTTAAATTISSTSSCIPSSALPGTIFVADVTKDISAYTLAEL
jgi:WD40 repeat protein